MSTAASKLKALRERVGLTIRAMAEELSMSPSSYIHYENIYKKQYFDREMVEKLVKPLTSRGVSRSEVLALAGFGPGDGSSFQVLSEAETISRVESGEAAPPNRSLVSVFDLAASAGHGALTGEYEAIAYSLAFPPDYLRRVTRADPGNLAIISVKGDSMTPTLNDDDIVMVDTSKTSLGYDGLFVLRFDDALHVKRVSRSRPGFVTIISDNRANYPEREYAVGDVQVVGKVLWKGGKV